jgi:release factor glutamine methyltransferase
LKNSTKNTQKSNEQIANDYDHLTPPDYPIAYKARKWFFCGLEFYIDENVLVPRFETETLVYEAAKFNTKTILDLCTGSGCIAVALAQTGFDVTATDISAAALNVARKNARAHKVKIKFVQSDLFACVKGKFDIITCNPPYIKTAEIGKRDKSILREPRIALDGGTDGLDFYRRIIKDAPEYLAPNGLIFFEVGDKVQSEKVKTLLQNAGYCDITVIGNYTIHARKVN